VTFRTIPDAPISTFELTLPEDPFSALGTNKDLCALTRTVTTKKTVKEKVNGKTKKVIRKTTKTVAESLVMPTALVGQNNAFVKQNTPVTVTGCPPARKVKKHEQKKLGKHTTK
jgi:hypothetical protein